MYEEIVSLKLLKKWVERDSYLDENVKKSLKRRCNIELENIIDRINDRGLSYQDIEESSEAISNLT